MRRHLITGRYGPGDRSRMPLGDGEVETRLDLVVGERSLGHGIGRALADLSRLGVFPSELGIDVLVLAAHVPEAWIRAVLAAESAHDVRAVSSAGAMGLMQVMPNTWDELRDRYRLGDDPFDPRDNILAGAAYLREMLDRYGTIGGMLAAYNAGPARYDEYLEPGRPLPAETRDYVAALAPILGGQPLPEGVDEEISRPTDWREAPLFVGPPGSSPSAGSPQSDRSPAADSMHHEEATPPSSEGMFVARSETGATQ